MIRAYHFLRADFTAREGDEPPWRIGEERTITGALKLCRRGYHTSPTWFDALRYAPGPIACVDEVSEPVDRNTANRRKQVSATRRLLAARDATRELRLFACDCALRALEREQKAGRESDPRSWAAVEVARQYAAGLATDEQLTAARAAARAAAPDAAWATTWATAWVAAEAAAWATAWGAAWGAEIQWQQERLDHYLNALVQVDEEVSS